MLANHYGLTFPESSSRIAIKLLSKQFFREKVGVLKNLILQFWSSKPRKRAWICIPVGYMLILQLLTGIPKPGVIRESQGPKLLEEFANELFGYPYWAQDLSHLPLFALLAWLWSWYFGGPQTGKSWETKAAWISFSYGILNEMLQYFVPQRFPSAGDVIMNLAGVALGLWLHAKLKKKVLLE